MAEIEWNAQQLQAFARSLNADKDGRKLRQRMQAQFDSITKTLRDRLRHEISTIQGVGTYPQEVAESAKFTTKLIGGPSARVQVVVEDKNYKGKFRELGKFVEQGYIYHPAWGHWRSPQPPEYLRQQVPDAPRAKTDAIAHATPALRDEIREVLNQYLDELTLARSSHGGI